MPSSPRRSKRTKGSDGGGTVEQQQSKKQKPLPQANDSDDEQASLLERVRRLEEQNSELRDELKTLKQQRIPDERKEESTPAENVDSPQPPIVEMQVQVQLATTVQQLQRQVMMMWQQMASMQQALLIPMMVRLPDGTVCPVTPFNPTPAGAVAMQQRAAGLPILAPRPGTTPPKEPPKERMRAPRSAQRGPDQGKRRPRRCKLCLNSRNAQRIANATECAGRAARASCEHENNSS